MTLSRKLILKAIKEEYHNAYPAIIAALKKNYPKATTSINTIRKIRDDEYRHYRTLKMMARYIK